MTPPLQREVENPDQYQLKSSPPSARFLSQGIDEATTSEDVNRDLPIIELPDHPYGQKAQIQATRAELPPSLLSPGAAASNSSRRRVATPALRCPLFERYTRCSYSMCGRNRGGHAESAATPRGFVEARAVNSAVLCYEQQTILLLTTVFA